MTTTEQSLRAQASEPRNQVRFDAGLFSPLGFGGLAYARDFGRYFQLETGVGGAVHGLHLSAMAKLATGTERHKFLVGVGPAAVLGGYFFPEGGFRLNGEVGYQYRARSGFTFMAAAGVTYSPGFQAACLGQFLCGTSVAPATRLGFGYSF